MAKIRKHKSQKFYEKSSIALMLFLLGVLAVAIYAAVFVKGGGTAVMTGATTATEIYKFECEDLAHINSPGMAVTTVTTSDSSGTEVKLSRFSSTAGYSTSIVNDYVEYDVQLPTDAPGGPYNVKVRAKKYNHNGKYKLYIQDYRDDGYVVQGPEVDLYDSSSSTTPYVESDLGTFNFRGPGLKKFRFYVTGKNANSGGYAIELDYILLTKSDAPTTFANLAPADGSTVPIGSQLTISATCSDSDGIDASSLRLWVDNTEVTASATKVPGSGTTASASITYGNFQASAKRTYSVKLEVKDKNGNLATKIWSFKASDLIAYWDMEGITGTDVADKSGNGNTGTINKGTGDTAEKITSGRFGKGLKFDGVDDYVSVPSASGFISTQGTIAFWIKANSATAPAGDNEDLVNIFQNSYQDYLVIRRDKNNGIYFGIDDDNNNKNDYEDTKISFRSCAGKLADTNWHHIAVAQDGNGPKIYIDGANCGAYTDTNKNYWTNHLDFSKTSAGVWLGKGHWGSFPGIMDDVKIWNRALSADEIKAMVPCSGSLRLEMPATVQAGTSVTLKATGITGCFNKKIYFKEDSCTNTNNIGSCDTGNAGAGCSITKSFGTEGSYKIYACMDVDGDAKYGPTEKIINALRETVPKIKIKYEPISAIDDKLHRIGVRVKNLPYQGQSSTKLSYKTILTVKSYGAGTVTSSPAGISCGRDCSENYEARTQVRLTASPASSCSYFISWTDDCKGASATCEVGMDKDKTVTASFNKYPPLAVIVDGGGWGTVSAQVAGSQTPLSTSRYGAQDGFGALFASGTQVTLTATPAEYSLFEGWVGCDSTTEDNKCVIAITESCKIVYVKFVYKPQLLIFTGSGSVTAKYAASGEQIGLICDEDCQKAFCGDSNSNCQKECGDDIACREKFYLYRVARVRANSQIMLTATASTGAQFSKYKITDANPAVPPIETTSNPYTFTIGRTDKNVNVIFKDTTPPTINARACLNGEAPSPNHRADIIAQVEDNIAVSDIRISVDGTERAHCGYAYQVPEKKTCQLRHISTDTNTHTYSVTAKDFSGNSQTSSGSFKLVDDPPALSIGELGYGTGTITSNNNCLLEKSPNYYEGYFTGGTQITLTANPDEDSVFLGWYDATNPGPYVYLSADNPYALTLTSRKSLYAKFEKIENKKKLTVTKNREGGCSATVTSTPELSCVAPSPQYGCEQWEGTFVPGTQITLTAVPSYSIFDGWYDMGANYALLQTSSSYTFTIRDNTGLEAQFHGGVPAHSVTFSQTGLPAGTEWKIRAWRGGEVTEYVSTEPSMTINRCWANDASYGYDSPIYVEGAYKYMSCTPTDACYGKISSGETSVSATYS